MIEMTGEAPVELNKTTEDYLPDFLPEIKSSVISDTPDFNVILFIG